MGMARVQVAVEYLLDRLALPAEARILQAEMTSDCRDVCLVVEHAGIEVASTEHLQTIWPTFRRGPDGSVRFENWGHT